MYQEIIELNAKHDFHLIIRTLPLTASPAPPPLVVLLCVSHHDCCLTVGQVKLREGAEGMAAGGSERPFIPPFPLYYSIDPSSFHRDCALSLISFIHIRFV